jgi:hypothetical protein
LSRGEASSKFGNKVRGGQVTLFNLTCSAGKKFSDFCTTNREAGVPLSDFFAEVHPWDILELTVLQMFLCINCSKAFVSACVKQCKMMYYLKIVSDLGMDDLTGLVVIRELSAAHRPSLKMELHLPAFFKPELWGILKRNYRLSSLSQCSTRPPVEGGLRRTEEMVNMQPMAGLEDDIGPAAFELYVERMKAKSELWEAQEKSNQARSGDVEVMDDMEMFVVGEDVGSDELLKLKDGEARFERQLRKVLAKDDAKADAWKSLFREKAPSWGLRD